MSKSRFAKRRWLRLIKALIEEADYFNPGWLPEEDISRMTVPQQKRHWNRHSDFERIAREAVMLHDSLSCLRP